MPPPLPPRRPLPNPDAVKDPARLWQIIREMHEDQARFAQVVEDLLKTSLQAPKPAAPTPEQATTERIIERLLIGTDRSTVSAQRALIPRVDTLPPVASAVSGEAVQLSTDNTIYVFQPGNPGSWVAATATAGTHQTSHQAGGTDELQGSLVANARVQTRIDDVDVGLRRAINLLTGFGIALSGADDAGSEESELTIALGPLLGTNGASYEFVVQTEEVTLSTVAATTDSTANLLRGTGIVLGVVHYITQTISGGGVTTHSVGDPTTAGRFRAADANLTAGTGFFNYLHLSSGSLSLVQLSDDKVRFTCDATPTQGKVRVSTLCLVMANPTS